MIAIPKDDKIGVGWNAKQNAMFAELCVILMEAVLQNGMTPKEVELVAAGFAEFTKEYTKTYDMLGKMSREEVKEYTKKKLGKKFPA